MKLDFISLYDNYFDDVYRYIYFKTGNSWDADDLVSEVFRKAYEKYRTVTDNPKAWLFTIARNTVIDFYRKNKDIVMGDNIELYTYPYYFEEVIEKGDELNCLRKSLNTLSKEELEVVNLRYFSELKYGEIAALLGKSEDSIKMKAFRIINKLKNLVKECMEG